MSYSINAVHQSEIHVAASLACFLFAFISSISHSLNVSTSLSNRKFFKNLTIFILKQSFLKIITLAKDIDQPNCRLFRNRDHSVSHLVPALSQRHPLQFYLRAVLRQSFDVFERLKTLLSEKILIFTEWTRQKVSDLLFFLKNTQTPRVLTDQSALIKHLITHQGAYKY